MQPIDSNFFSRPNYTCEVHFSVRNKNRAWLFFDFVIVTRGDGLVHSWDIWLDPFSSSFKPLGDKRITLYRAVKSTSPFTRNDRSMQSQGQNTVTSVSCSFISPHQRRRRLRADTRIAIRETCTPLFLLHLIMPYSCVFLEREGCLPHLPSNTAKDGGSFMRGCIEIHILWI